MSGAVSDELVDAEADAIILACLDLAAPKSFFLYAGAGSGKTRSLVEAIRTVCEKQGRKLSLSGRQIGVITYTNAACDEIKQRLEFDPRVEVSTIHAFAWALIGGYDANIREWLATNLLEEIAELEAAQAKGRAGSKAASDRARSIESKRRRHAGLNEIIRFVYSPTGDNRIGLVYLLYDLLAPVVFEIDVDIGRLLALARDKALEQQFVLDGIDRGDVEGDFFGVHAHGLAVAAGHALGQEIVCLQVDPRR